MSEQYSSEVVCVVARYEPAIFASEIVHIRTINDYSSSEIVAWDATLLP